MPVKFKPHIVSLALPLLFAVIAVGLCALLFHVTDAFEHSFLKLAGHDIRHRTETVTEELASHLNSGDLAAVREYAEGKRADGVRVMLTPGEYRLLEVLLSHPGRVHTRAALLDMIQLEAKDITDRTIDVMLAHMRPKLGAWAAHIETARGIGYRFSP